MGKVSFDLLAVDRIYRLIEDKNLSNFTSKGLSYLIEGDGSLTMGVRPYDFPVDPQGLTVGDDPERIHRPNAAGNVGDNPDALRSMAELEEPVGSGGGKVSPEYVRSTGGRLLVYDKYELRTRDGVLNVEALSRVKGYHCFFV